MTFPENIFVPMGVVSAALIAGGIAYAGFISTKESKVSEFRQKWISDLREEISIYVSSIDTLMQNISKYSFGKILPRSKIMESRLTYGSLYQEMLKSRLSILLRINTKEKEKSDFERNETFVKSIEKIYTSFENGKFDDAYTEIEELISISRSILKHEWNRARDGENRFQRVKKLSQWIMGFFASILMAILMTVAYESWLALYAPTGSDIKSCPVLTVIDGSAVNPLCNSTVRFPINGR